MTTTTLTANEIPATTTREATYFMDVRTESITGTTKQLESTDSIETTSDTNCVTNVVKVVFSIFFLAIQQS